MDIINVINIDPLQEVKTANPFADKNVVVRNREERALSIVKQSKQYGFPVRFWEGVIEQHGHTGISKAFKKIIKNAMDAGLPRVLIAEDDMIFTSPGAYNYFIDKIPEDYDIYLGGVYSAQYSDDGRIINGYSGNTLMMINERFYDFILSDEKNDHLDRWLGNFAYRFKYFVCLPFVVRQMEGWSENHRKETRHESYLQKMKFYEG